MKVKDIYPSRFLKADDVEPPLILTIRSHTFEDIGVEKERKFILYFSETDKVLVVNKTNLNSIEMILGTDETDQWIGKTIELFKDHVQMGAEIVAAIRVRRATEPTLAV